MVVLGVDLVKQGVFEKDIAVELAEIHCDIFKHDIQLKGLVLADFILK